MRQIPPSNEEQWKTCATPSSSGSAWAEGLRIADQLQKYGGSLMEEGLSKDVLLMIAQILLLCSKMFSWTWPLSRLWSSTVMCATLVVSRKVALTDWERQSEPVPEYWRLSSPCQPPVWARSSQGNPLLLSDVEPKHLKSQMYLQHYMKIVPHVL